MKKILIALILIFTVLACNNANLGQANKFIISPDHKYYIQYNQNLIELSPDTYVTKDKKISDYLSSSFLFIKNPFANSNLVTDLSKYFPEPLQGVEKSSVTAEVLQMPIFENNGKKHIDTVKLAEMLKNIGTVIVPKVDIQSDLIQKQPVTYNFDGLKLHILNANGINGVAKKTGDILANKLNVTFVSENNKTRSNYTYIGSKTLDNDYLLKIVETAKLNNVKVDNSIAEDSYAATVVLGKNTNKYNVSVLTNKEKTEVLTLLNKNYNVSLGTKNENYKFDDNNIYVYYNPEDVLIAKQIANLLPKTKLEEDATIKDKIIVTTNR